MKRASNPFAVALCGTCLCLTACGTMESRLPADDDSEAMVARNDKQALQPPGGRDGDHGGWNNGGDRGGGRHTGGGGGGWNNTSGGGGGGGWNNTTGTGTTGSGGGWNTSTGTAGTTGSGGGWNNTSGGGGGGWNTTTGSGTTGQGGSTGTTGSGTTTGTSGNGTTGAGGSTTGSGGGTTTGSAGGAESWVWVYTNYAQSLTTIAANPKAFTHISPTFYSLNYNYQSGVASYSNCAMSSGSYDCTNAGTNNFSGLTTQQFTQKVAALGLVTVPAIYAGADNGGTDTGVENILNNTNGAGTAFISAMVQEAVSNGYGGYNLDFEMGSGVNGAYTDKFVSFVNSFKAALSQHSMSLSVDVIPSNINGTWCSSNSGYADFAKLTQSSIDRIIVEAYSPALGTASSSCQSTPLSSSSPALCPLDSSGANVTVLGLMNFMCSNLPNSMVVIGLESYSSASNPIAGSVISAMESYGINKIAIWPQAQGSYPFLSNQGLVASQSDWYSVLTSFLGH